MPYAASDAATAPTPAKELTTTKVSAGGLTDEELVVHLQECIRAGEEYRDRFRTTWEETEKQIRCDPPETWKQKDDWQTKIYIPLQAKKEETAIAYLKKMVFGKGRFFDLAGKKGNEDAAQALIQLMSELLEEGAFDAANDFVITEAVGSPGSSFLKLLMGDDGYPRLVWRSPYNVLIDPQGGQKLAQKRFIIDVHKKDLTDLIRQAKKGGLYAGHAAEVDAFLKVAADEAETLKAKAASGIAGSKEQDALIVVRGIDDATEVTVPARYKSLDLHEASIRVPNKAGTGEEFLTCVLVNKSHLIRRDANPYGCHNWVGARTKPRKYDWYGRGYLENGRGFQDLSNSMVNLGFDSAKISAMDIIMLDDNKVKDASSIKYKPLAVWKLKGSPREAVDIRRQPVSAITDIIRGLQLIDQLDQDASGITRGVQGAPGISGDQGSGSGTLGEYQSQLQLVDQRFLDQGRFLEHDYIIPLLELLFSVIVNPKLFSQAKCDALIGTKTVDDIQLTTIPDPGDPMRAIQVPQVVGTKQVPKLDLAKLRDGSLAFHFKAVGLTQFMGRMEQVQKLQQGLQAVMGDPSGTLRALTKVDVLWKKIWQISEVEDYEEFLRGTDEVKKLLAQMGGTEPGMPMVPRPEPQPQGAPS